MLATAAIDPTFGQAGFVIGLIASGSGDDMDNATAEAVDANGKTVVVGFAGENETRKLAVRRYNTNGSLDTTFGTNGETDPPLPGSTSDDSPNNLLIKPDGSIVLVAQSYVAASSTTPNIVVQLTPNGQLDSTFGTNGEFTLTTSGYILTNVGMQANGQIIVAGTTYGTGPTGSPQTGLVAIRLTATGTLDTTFNGTGSLLINVPGTTAFSSTNEVIVAGTSLAVAPSGQIYLGTTLQRIVGPNGTQTYLHGDLARITSTGTLDATYGSNGILSLPASLSNTLRDLAVQPDNKLVVAGTINQGLGQTVSSGQAETPFLLRYLPDGMVDSSFVGMPITTASDQTGPHGGFNSIALGTDGTITTGGYFDRSQLDYVSHLNTSATDFLVEQFTPSGQINTPFGVHGVMKVNLPPETNSFTPPSLFNGIGVALTLSRDVVLLGTIFGNYPSIPNAYDVSFLVRLTPTLVLNNNTGDYDGDGTSDIAAELSRDAVFAYRPATGADFLLQYGQAGAGLSIPAPGDYDGFGKTNIAVYLPALGALAYHPSSGGPDRIDYFGPAGIGASIPASGDYDGDGRTDVAVYIPAMGAFAIQPTAGGANYYAPFGVKGAGQSIPAPGDYDGDGKTDLAVYIPSQGILAYRPSSGGKDMTISFGPGGPGNSIPAPGDYDGDGKTDVAIYMPGSGAFAIHPSSGVANYLIPFGMPGQYNSIPAPGDYDGDGRTDAAVYLPTLGKFAYRPSQGGDDVLQGFGRVGFGQTIPDASITYGQAPFLTTNGAPANNASAAIFIPLTDDLVNPTAKKPTQTRLM